MEYRNLLSKSASRLIVDTIRNSVFDQTERFDELFELAFDHDPKISWKALWTVEKILLVESEFINIEKFNRLTEYTTSCKHDSAQRILLSILLILQSKPSFELPIPIVNKCFEWFISNKLPVAVQVLALKNLVAYTKKYPEMKQELLAYLENYEQTSSRAALLSCTRNSIKSLKI